MVHGFHETRAEDLNFGWKDHMAGWFRNSARDVHHCLLFAICCQLRLDWNAQPIYGARVKYALYAEQNKALNDWLVEFVMINFRESERLTLPKYSSTCSKMFECELQTYI